MRGNFKNSLKFIFQSLSPLGSRDILFEKIRSFDGKSNANEEFNISVNWKPLNVILDLISDRVCIIKRCLLMDRSII